MLFSKTKLTEDDALMQSLKVSREDVRLLKLYNMIPGSKGLKSDASLLAEGFLNLGPAKNVSKQPFFEEK